MLAMIVAAVAASACSTAHYAGVTTPRSVYDEAIRPGLYALSASNNAILLPAFGSAQGVWSDRAEELCGKDQYQVLLPEQSTNSTSMVVATVAPGRFVPVSTYKLTTKGYVLCNAAGLSKEEALKIIAAIPEQNAAALSSTLQTQLDGLGGIDCATAKIDVPAENFTQRGRLLMSQSKYKEALTCLHKAIALGPNSGAYREACEVMGNSYEMGWGVPSNLALAKEWYAKAGIK